MKMLPVQLSLNPPLGLWSDVLWRCPPPPPSQLAELKTQLPASLPSDPRLWGREDVSVFLRFCEREFDLPKVEYDLFQMNGKALCLLTRADFGHRCPGAGDVLHNVLQMLIIESHMMQWHLPNSPVTPTSRYPLSPHSHPPTPTWPPIAPPPESPFHSAAHMHHFMAPNSVTLSPPPSVDSQASSPPQNQQQDQQNAVAAVAAAAVAAAAVGSMNGSSGGGGGGGSSTCSSTSSSGSSGGSSSNSSNVSMAGLGAGSGVAFVTNNAASNSSNHSDSDEESYSEAKNNAAAAVAAQYNTSPPTTPILKDIKQSLSQQITNSFVNSWTPPAQPHKMQQQQGSVGNGGSVSAPTTPSFMQPVKREFFPENSEPNTNGRLLWDFLQQLLNDRNQKYSDLIAWKCRDTGVFKIVDPAGLAKLWGIQKNHLSMNYDKMSRALRYYYRVNILRKVQGERHCYQFLRNPTELKNIKNISLLRQTINNSTTATNGGGANVGPTNGVNASASNGASSINQSSHQQHQQQQQCPGTNLSNTNWSLPHQSMTASLQQAAAAAAVAAAQQHQQQQQQQTTPQRPSSHSNNNNNNSSSNSSNITNNLSLSNSSNNNNSNNHMTLPSAAAAAVAAAAAAAYGPPPTSPLFMHAINGAFHYLSSNTNNSVVPPPNSPAAVHHHPSTPTPTSSDKFQFGALKLENNNSNNSHEHEDMKPTDLSVSSSSNTEKRPYSSPSAEDCYPLIRNADGLTTIKLIRYNNDSNDNTTKLTQSSSNTSEQQMPASPPASSLHMNSHQEANDEKPTPMNTDSDGGGEGYEMNGQFNSMMPTDLRK